VLGMVGFDRWTENAAEMHVACSSIGAVRALLRPAFSYLFEETGRRIALGTVSGNNAQALKFDRHLGFREVHRVKDGHSAGVDIVFLEMRREECRWIG
jgi:L-amino acid N-acyltransferase YncA